MLSSEWMTDNKSWDSPYDLVADGSSPCRPVQYLTVFDFTTLQNPDSAAYLALPVYEATLDDPTTKVKTSPSRKEYQPFQTVEPMKAAAPRAGDMAPIGATLSLDMMERLINPSEHKNDRGHMDGLVHHILRPGVIEELISEEWHHTVFLLLSELCEQSCPPQTSNPQNFTSLVAHATSAEPCPAKAAEAWLDIALGGNHLQPDERKRFAGLTLSSLSGCISELSSLACRCDLWRKISSIPSTIAPPTSRTATARSEVGGKAELEDENRLHLCTHNTSTTTHIKEGTVSAHVITADGYTGASVSSPLSLGVHVPHAEVTAVIEFVVALHSGPDDRCWYTNSLGHQQSLPQLWACEWMFGAGDHVVIRCPIVKALKATHERLFWVDADARDVFATEVMLHAVPYSKLSWLRRPSDNREDYSSMTSEWTIGPIPLCRGQSTWPHKLPQELRFDRYLRYIERLSTNESFDDPVEHEPPFEAPGWGLWNSSSNVSLGACVVMDGQDSVSYDKVKRYVLSLMNTLPVEKLFLYSPTTASDELGKAVEEFAEDEDRVEVLFDFANAFFGEKSSVAASSLHYRRSMDDSAFVHCLHRARLYRLEYLLTISHHGWDVLPEINDDRWALVRSISRYDRTIAAVEAIGTSRNCQGRRCESELRLTAEGRSFRCDTLWLTNPELVIDFANGEPRARPGTTIIRNVSVVELRESDHVETEILEWNREWQRRRGKLKEAAEARQQIYKDGEESREGRHKRHQQRIDEYHQALLGRMRDNEGIHSTEEHAMRGDDAPPPGHGAVSKDSATAPEVEL
ncbi:hypothetical protein FOL47_002147 [Perkinsus chesapeaki]|uniref:Uncharacterized protein n=1 Tax=Perkinsus chesapeaki TaxID=330153 RepID=A0A7J6MF84_PERCH|nr:hypothetical protein FOL47_002147 [Perkinsus chesapeaki]